MLAPMKLLTRWLLLSAALLLLSYWDLGVQVKGFGAAMAASLVLGLLNAFVRPLLIVLTLPVTVLTLGLFLFAINAFTFQMASGLLEGFQVQGFWSAVLASVLYSLWGLLIDRALESLIPSRPPQLPPLN